MNMMADLARVRAGRVLHEKMRIGGELVGSDRVIEVFNPYTGAVVGTVPKASADDVRRALSIGRRFKSKLSRHDRYRICQRTSDLIRSRAAEISDLISAECGICKKDSLYEVGRACDVFFFAGNAALQDDGQVFSCDLTPHGKAIAAKAVYKRQVLEMGGNDPLIVMEDADLDEAAALAAAGSYKNSGQRCTAVKRILVQQSIADRFIELLVERTRAVKCGDPMDPETD